MPFVTVPGLTGKVYVPEQGDHHVRKHPCPDCLSCQMCSESRCRVCRNRESVGDGQSKRTGPKKTDIVEKIEHGRKS